MLEECAQLGSLMSRATKWHFHPFTPDPAGKLQTPDTPKANGGGHETEKTLWDASVCPPIQRGDRGGEGKRRRDQLPYVPFLQDSPEDTKLWHPMESRVPALSHTPISHLTSLGSGP